METKTNAIGKGTRNFPLNAITEEMELLGKLAFQMGKKSQNALIKELYVLGLKQVAPEAAAQIERMRAERMRRIGSFGLFLLAAFQIFAHSMDIKRTPIRSSRTVSVRVVRRNEVAA